MTTYIVSYDLRKPRRDYESLFEAIKSESNWWHHLGSTWVVISTKSAMQLTDKLKATMDDDDKILVAESGGVGAWFGFTDKGSQWLKDHL